MQKELINADLFLCDIIKRNLKLSAPNTAINLSTSQNSENINIRFVLFFFPMCLA